MFKQFFNKLFHQTKPAFVRVEKTPSYTDGSKILYISRATNTIYINNKGGKINMEKINGKETLENLVAAYNDLCVARDKAVAEALANKEYRIQDRFEAVKAEIEKEVIAEITREAEAPFAEQIALFEKILVLNEEAPDEEVVEDTTEVVEATEA